MEEKTPGQTLGRLGGLKTKKRHGREYFKRISKLAAKARKRNAEKRKIEAKDNT